MDKDRIMKVVDETGAEKEMYILFTTSLEETGKKYVFYFDQKDENGQVFVSVFNDDGKLFPVESDEEWSLLEEIFNEFIKESQENSPCSGNCSECDEECEDKE